MIEEPHLQQEAESPQLPEVKAPKKHGKWWNRMLNSRFLVISIVVHLIFGMVATYLVVQTITQKRKLTFTAAPPSANPGRNTTEHKVQMAQKRKTMSVPTQARKVTTTAVSAVALPEMPAMPTMSGIAAPKMAGMGGPVSFGATANAGAAGGPVPFFGFRTAQKSCFVGAFYDLKQSQAGKPTPGMNPGEYGIQLLKFVKTGWQQSFWSKYFRGPDPIYATRIFSPIIPAEEGPKAFGLEKRVQPSMWVVHYKARVAPPESGTYYFVGAGDDVMMVRFNGKLVLDRCWNIRTDWKANQNYDYGFTGMPGGFAKSDPIEVRAGNFYDMEVVIGEQPGGSGWAQLLIEKDGAQYNKDDRGNPILPIFRVSPAEDPLPPGDYVIHATGGSAWIANRPSTSFE